MSVRRWSLIGGVLGCIPLGTALAQTTPEPQVRALGSPVSMPLSTALSTTVNARLFGAHGDVVQLATSATNASGDKTLFFTSTAGLRIGELVQGRGIPHGTTISALTPTSVTLSQALSEPEYKGLLVDFPQHDDASAINAAQATATSRHSAVYLPPGRYYASSLNAFGGSYTLDGASESFGSSGFPGIADQSQAIGLLGRGLSYQFDSPANENGDYISGIFHSTGTTNSYQKNAQSIRITNLDKYVSYKDAAGKPQLATHDVVGQFIAAEQGASNDFGNTWVWNHVLGLDAGSNGSSIIGEAQIIDHRTSPEDDFDGQDTVGGYDEIYNCDGQCLFAHFMQGSALNNRPGLVNGYVFRRGTVSNIAFGQIAAAYRDADGHTAAARHVTDWAIYASGLGFFQTLHVGGGAPLGDRIPTEGFSVDPNGRAEAPSLASRGMLTAPGFAVTGDPNGAISLGSATSATAVTPYIDFNQGHTGANGSLDHCLLLGAGGANLDVICNNTIDAVFFREGVAFKVPASAPALTIDGGKVNLDRSGTMWAQEISGKVVIGTGNTRLFSIDKAGNVIAKGTVTGGGSP